MKNEIKNQARYSDLSMNSFGGCEDMRAGGGEDIPPGGWRGGGEDIPAGGWRGGGEDIPVGGWRRIPATLSEEPEQIPAGGFRSVIDVYRSQDGTGYFKFRFYPIGDYYEIDILAMPSYGVRESGVHTTHRLNSTRGGYKICFGDPTVIRTLNVARQWAAIWSEHTMNYIKYGRSFPNT